MKSFLKKIVSRTIIDKIQSFLSKLDNFVIPFFASHAMLSSLYYFFFSREFGREHQSVLKGRIAYKQSLDDINNSSVLLRRNTHRLEKGLIMRPSRDMFASAYIVETVDCYIKCMKAETLCAEELKWATDVLSKYFSVVIDSAKIVTLRNQFEKAKMDVCDENIIEDKNSKYNEKYIPYQQGKRERTTVNTAQLESLFIQRRSVRWYRQMPVELELIEQAISLASLAPSACNRQPFEFYYLTGKDAVTIAKLAMGTAGFADNIPALFVVVGDLSAYPAERDKHVIYIDASLAAMQLMLALETLGLSSCPINWPDINFREKSISEKLNLALFQRPVMLMSVGYACDEGMIPFSQKKQVKQLLKELKL